MNRFFDRISDLAVPADMKGRLASFLGDLDAAIADDEFRCLVLYGDILRDDFTFEFSSVNLLVICSDAGIDTLERIGAIAGDAIRDMRVVPLVMTYEEMVLSADVFPVRYIEMKKNYRVIVGDDIIGELDIPAENVRLHCEQQLRDLSLALRREYLAACPEPARLCAALMRYLPEILSVVKFYAEFRSGQSFSRASEALSYLKGQLGIPTEAMNEIAALKKSAPPAGGAEMKRLYGKMISFVNEMTKLAESLS